MIIRKAKHDDELDFIEDFLKTEVLKDKAQLKEVIFEKLDRVGYSGVSVYVVEIVTDSPIPYNKMVFKVAKRNETLRKKIASEKENFNNQVWHKLSSVPDECLYYEARDYTGIAYPHKDHATFSTLYQTINLHSLFESVFRRENEQSTAQPYASIEKVVNSIYRDAMKGWRKGYQITSDSWGKQYERHIREKRAMDRIDTMLKIKRTADSFLYNERKFKNPINVVRSIMNSNQKFLTRVVHGDLHQRNILVFEGSDDYLPWLIDFEWVTEDKHYLIDYCLLECSIKFQYVTPLLTEQEIFSFENALLKEKHSIRLSHSRIVNLYKILQGIRKHAYSEYESAMIELGETVSKADWQNDYLTAITLMTTGLIGIQNFEGIDQRGLICSLLYHTNELDLGKKLKSIGEHDIVHKYINKKWETVGYPKIILDKGDDCSAFELSDPGNVVVVSTDPCPIPVAWLLNDLDYTVYGWYSMLINLSDLASMGASPIGIQLSVEMSDDMPVSEFVQFMDGVKRISDLYRCPIIGGNIKDSSRFTCTGTIFGEMKQEKLLRRNTAKVGDRLIVIGNMGMFWGAVFDYYMPKVFEGSVIDNLIKFPRPKLEEGKLIAEHGLATSCMDSSDGLISCFHEIAEKSDVSVELDESSIQLDNRVMSVCQQYGIKDTLNLALTWGDWQLVITVSDAMFEEFKRQMKSKFRNKENYCVVGKIINKEKYPVIVRRTGKRYSIEDFGSKRFNDVSYFSNGLDSYMEYLKGGNFLTEIKN